MTWTDKIIFFSAIILFWRGWDKGLIRTILGPLSLIIFTIVSYIYYMLTQKFLIAAIIGIAGPIVLNIILSIGMNIISSPKEKQHLFLPSRIIAAFLNLLWGEFILIVTIFSLLLIPLQLPSLNKAQADITASSAYVLLKPKIDTVLKSHNAPTIDPAKLSAFSDPEKLKDLEKSSEYQDLVNDKRIQDIIADPSINKLIEEKQIAQLMQHPKILELTKDPELLKKFLALYSKVLK